MGYVIVILGGFLNRKRRNEREPTFPPTPKIKINIHIGPNTLFPPYLIVITAPLNRPRIPQNYEKLYWLIVCKKAPSHCQGQFQMHARSQFSPKSFHFFLNVSDIIFHNKQ